MSDAKYCDNCKSAYIGNQKFCIKCGAALSDLSVLSDRISERESEIETIINHLKAIIKMQDHLKAKGYSYDLSDISQYEDSTKMPRRIIADPPKPEVNLIPAPSVTPRSKFDFMQFIVYLLIAGVGLYIPKKLFGIYGEIATIIGIPIAVIMFFASGVKDSNAKRNQEIHDIKTSPAYVENANQIIEANNAIRARAEEQYKETVVVCQLECDKMYADQLEQWLNTIGRPFYSYSQNWIKEHHAECVAIVRKMIEEAVSCNQTTYELVHGRFQEESSTLGLTVDEYKRTIAELEAEYKRKVAEEESERKRTIAEAEENRRLAKAEAEAEEKRRLEEEKIKREIAEMEERIREEKAASAHGMTVAQYRLYLDRRVLKEDAIELGIQLYSGPIGDDYESLKYEVQYYKSRIAEERRKLEMERLKRQARSLGLNVYRNDTIESLKIKIAEEQEWQEKERIRQAAEQAAEQEEERRRLAAEKRRRQAEEERERREQEEAYNAYMQQQLKIQQQEDEIRELQLKELRERDRRRRLYGKRW